MCVGDGEPGTEQAEFLGDPLKDGLSRIDGAVESLDERWPVLLASFDGAPPFEIQVPVAAVRQVDIRLQPQPGLRSARGNIGNLLGAQETLIRTGGPAEIVVKSGYILPPEIG